MRIGPQLSFASTCAPIEALRGDYDGDEINLHLPQGAHVTAELHTIMSVSEQIVTGQSGSPVVKLIQDAVVDGDLASRCVSTGPNHRPVAFWFTHIDHVTHCPRSLGRAIFSQVALDLPEPADCGGTIGRLMRIRHNWDTFRHKNPDHPTVRAFAAAGIDYHTTGYALLSMCVPSNCCFQGRSPNTNRLVTMYRRARCLPASMVPIVVDHGLFLGGWVTSDTLTGMHGLLGHIYHHHGPAAGLRFLDAMQRMTTSVSLYSYCPSVGLDDCLLRMDIRLSTRQVIAQSVADVNATLQATRARSAIAPPYQLDGDDTTEMEIGRLVAVRIKSESIIMQHTLGQRSKRHGSPIAPGRFNQIALLCMVGTKGSVSNLVQCCHSLGQQVIQDERLPVTDYDRVFPHDEKDPANCVESRGLLWRESFIDQGVANQPPVATLCT